MVGTLKLGSAGDSPVLNVSETPAASGCVCAYAHTWVCGALPSWCELWPGLLQQPVSPAGAAPSLPTRFGVTAGVPTWFSYCDIW